MTMPQDKMRRMSSLGSLWLPLLHLTRCTHAHPRHPVHAHAAAAPWRLQHTLHAPFSTGRR